MTLKTRGQLILIQRKIGEVLDIFNQIDELEKIRLCYSFDSWDGLDLSVLLSDTKNTVDKLIDTAEV